MSSSPTQEAPLLATSNAPPANVVRQPDLNVEALFDATTDAILIHRHLRYVYANRAALALLGRTRDEIVGRSPFELVPPRFRLLLAERLMVGAGKSVPMAEIEERLLHASGAEMPVEVVDIPITFRGELATLVHVRDIRARRALEIRLRAADRIASASIVATEVAHGVALPLKAAMANVARLEALLGGGAVDANVSALLSGIHQHLECASHCANEAEVFSCARRRKPTRVDPRKLLEAAIMFLGPELRSRANFVERYEPAPLILGDAARLAHVFVDLLRTAVEALPSSSRRRNDVTVSLRRSSETEVEVRIEGTGSIETPDEAVLEPPPSTGERRAPVTVALAAELLASEHGALTTRREASRTAFVVTLPIAVDIATAKLPRQHGRNILVVEDDERAIATLRVALCGHKTSISRTEEDALARLERGESYDLVFSEILSERVDGADLYRRVRSSWPGLENRIVFLTGAPFISRTEEFLAKVPNDHLQKPLDYDEVLDLVDELFAA
jgi:PAS domain S-box-containing protein